MLLLVKASQKVGEALELLELHRWNQPVQGRHWQEARMLLSAARREIEDLLRTLPAARPGGAEARTPRPPERTAD